MKIGVLGVGAIGGTVARKLAAAGQDVKVANSRGRDAVADFAAKIGAEASDLEGVGEDVEALVLSIPYGAIESMDKGVFAKLSDGAFVIDTGNYYPEIRDAAIEGLGDGQVESLWLQELIGKPVVKSFNTLLAYSLAELGREKGEPGRLAMQVAADDEAQRQAAMQLVDECGFDPYDAGTLADSWRMQPTAAGYCCDYTAAELSAVKEASTQTPEVVAERRRRVMTGFDALTGGDYSHENVIRVNRAQNV